MLWKLKDIIGAIRKEMGVPFRFKMPLSRYTSSVYDLKVTRACLKVASDLGLGVRVGSHRELRLPAQSYFDYFDSNIHHMKAMIEHWKAILLC